MAKFSVKKPLTVFVVVLAIVVLGVVAYTKMTPDLMPNMDFPYVIIVTTDPGASPESVEADITRPMEQSMATLDQIKTVTSTSQDSASMVMLEFEDGVNMDTISVDIQQKISVLQGSWDDTVGTPYVLKINPSMLPVMVAAISCEGMDVYELSDFVEDEILGKLEGISGVASVDVSGSVTRQAHVILDEKKLDALSDDVAAAVRKLLGDTEAELLDAQEEVKEAREQLDSAKSSMAAGVAGTVEDALEEALPMLRQLYAAMPDTTMSPIENTGDIQRPSTPETPEDPELPELPELPDLPEGGGSGGTTPTPPGGGTTPSQPNWSEIGGNIGQLAGSVLTEEQVVQLYNTIVQVNNAMVGAKKAMAPIMAKTNAQLQHQVYGDTYSGVLSLIDGITQLATAEIQLTTAETQIESGLDQLADAKKDIDDQADMSGTLSISTVSQLLTAQNFSMPAGYIDDENGVQYMVSVGETVSTREELENMVILDLDMDGVKPITLGDIAAIVVTDNAGEIYTKVNGENGILATFTKQSNYATAAASNNISARFEELTAEYEGLDFAPLMDQGDYIYLIVETITSSLLWGALFSVVVLFLFLRDWRPTVITLVSIPVSVIAAIVAMYFSGVTINMISLSGLAVAVGMLVDNSVVVIENIYRLRAKGVSIIQATVSGTQQVVGAVAASTLTTVCVFAPIVFVEGLTRQLFTDLALTITYSLMASLLVSITLVPAMATGMLRSDSGFKPGLLDKIYPAYRKAIAFSLDHKAGVLLLSLVLLVTTAWAAISRGFIFMPQMDMNNLTVSITMPEDATREEAVAMADDVLEKLMTIEDVQDAGFMMGGTSLLGMGGGGGSYDITGYVTLAEGKFGSVVSKQLDEMCKDMACEVSAGGIMDQMMGMMTGSGVSMTVYGNDMDDLQSTAKAIAEKLNRIEGIAESSDGLEESAAALQVNIDRAKAASHGMTVAQIYMKIATALQDSASLSDVTLDNVDMSLSVDAVEGSVVTRETLLKLEITPDATISMSGSSDMSAMMADDEDDGDGTFLLGDVATVEETVSMNVINRDQQRRCVTVSATLAEGYNVTKVTSEAERIINNMTLPEGITVEFGGENQQIMDALSQLMIMLALGVVLVYFIMVAQFQSLKSPFIVMFTIPLAFTGGFMALLIAGIEVSVISLIGFILLVGIIVNNGIVLVDYINQQRLAGMERREAIIDAGVTRLRPILMTSLTTILGMIVTATAKNAGTALMQPIALVTIGGLTYATLMTLFVVPCMYDIFSKKELRKVDEEELKLLNI